MSGTAGRTNYSEWNSKTNALLSQLEAEEEAERTEAQSALGNDGKYAASHAEATERTKQEDVSKVKKVLDNHKARELGVVQVLHSLLDAKDSDNDNDCDTMEEGKNTSENVHTRFITCQDVSAGKRVLNISDTKGPGKIILTQDLTNLQSQMGKDNTTTSSSNNNDIKGKGGLSPKSYPGDVENSAPDHVTGGGIINGLIKVSISNVHDCTLSLNCKVITGLLEISHCSNVTVILNKDSTIVTVQADLCQNLTLEFHDAPSGKGISPIPGRNPLKYWGEDKDDRIFHAGVENLVVKSLRDGYVDHETKADFRENGAKAVGNASAEEVQFVTSVVEGELITERVLRQGTATGTSITGALGGGDESGGGARAMTAREMKEVQNRKEQIRKSVDERLGGIKILDKDGKEVPKVVKSDEKIASDDNNNGDDDAIEELYAGMSAADIDTIINDCDAQKSKGNEAFSAGEYGQAVLLYTLTLDRAAELPDLADNNNAPVTGKQLYPRHMVLSNRSAAFLKLGHHDKALADGTEAARLEPAYVKGVFRKGLALHAMGKYSEAITPLAAALKIEPKNKQIKQALQFAEVRMQQEIRQRIYG